MFQHLEVLSPGQGQSQSLTQVVKLCTRVKQSYDLWVLQRPLSLVFQENLLQAHDTKLSSLKEELWKLKVQKMAACWQNCNDVQAEHGIHLLAPIKSWLPEGIWQEDFNEFIDAIGYIILLSAHCKVLVTHSLNHLYCVMHMPATNWQTNKLG